MSTDVVKREQAGVTRPFTSEEEAVIRTELVTGLTDAQFNTFAYFCREAGLNPLKREVYAVVRGQGANRKMSIQIAIDAYRKYAASDPNYAGQTAPQWCGDDGEWRDVWVSNQPPLAARVGVYRKGSDHPTWGVAHFDEYAQKTSNGLAPMWQKMPRNQLAKCAESLALRKALPERLGGIYTDVEMTQADTAPVELLSPEQVDELVALAVAAGRDAGRARARAERLPVAKFDAALAAMQQLAREAEAIVDAEAVEA
jgi:phage recombination protein Bet